MISTLDRYLLRRLISSFAVVFLGVVGLAATLDLLANADEAVEGAEKLGGLGVYLIARLPLIALELAPIAGLLSALVTLLALARSGELAAAGALGAGQGRSIRALLPAAIGFGLAMYFIAELAAPPAAATLRAMGLEPFARLARPTEAIWLREDQDIARINKASADDNTLTGVRIFRRDADGRLTEEVRAARAERAGSNGWTFHDVTVLPADGGSSRRMNVLAWPRPLGPGSFGLLAAHPSELPMQMVRDLGDHPGASAKPPFFYELWVQRKYAAPVGAALMLLLAVPFAGRMTRGRSMGWPLAAGLLVGFAYFVFESLAMAAAETGAISPLAGAWGPPMTLALATATMMAFQEKPG